MKIAVDNLDIYFPYKEVHDEQLTYMKFLKEVLDNKSQGIIEMPTGTGKTVSMFALVCSYRIKFPEKLSKVVFCTRTVSQLEKAMEELRVTQHFLGTQGLKSPKSQIISARRNLCINTNVMEAGQLEKVDSSCKKMTKYKTPVPCQFYEEFERSSTNIEAPKETMNIEDFKEYGKESGICPYFASKAMIPQSEIILCNYPYLIDYRANEELTRHLDKNSLVLIDEAHNIDSVCLDSVSVRLDKNILDKALDNLALLDKEYEKKKEDNFESFEKEYKRLVAESKGQVKATNKQNEGHSTNRLISTLEGADLSKFKSIELVPGSLRKVAHFFSFARRILSFLLNYMKIKEVSISDTESFLATLKSVTYVDESAIALASRRLDSLLEAINYLDINELAPISMVFSFIEVMSLFPKGFKVIYEPYYDTGRKITPVIQLVCLDCSLVFGSLTKIVDSVVLTSGTMTPIDVYARVLRMTNLKAISIEPPTANRGIMPLIVTKANDQTPLTTEYTERGNTILNKNYGELLLELSKVVPDGLVVFFPSYSYLEEIVTEWNKLGLIESILNHKLIFVETKDQGQTSESLLYFKEAIERGRGGIFLSVARGKVAEGVDFKDHLCRCVLVIGIPFQYTRSRALLARTDYLKNNFNIEPKEFITFDAIKQVAQCLGRAIRGKSDYGLMILADRRYTGDKQKSLPKWIANAISSENSDLQINILNAKVRKYFISMSR